MWVSIGSEGADAAVFCSGGNRTNRLRRCHSYATPIAACLAGNGWYFSSDQPCDGLPSADGMTLIIHGTPNLSIREPKPGDQKVSPNGMTALPPSDN